ncbi:MAG TPA: hypothetical protein VHR43_07870, partial [Gemmatimonadales bacterium]|nr:hypothetical protein [Gemmatimonadales bacterium]
MISPGCRLILLGGGLLATSPVLAQAQSRDTAAVTAIRAGRLVDPATGVVARDQVILVQGRKITAAGPNVVVPEGALVVDLSRETV